MKIHVKFITMVLVVGALFMGACTRVDGGPGKAAAGAPDFSLSKLDGGTVKLSDLLKNKKVVLVFWASWCGYCVKEVPAVKAFYKSHSDKVAVLGVNVGESKAKVESFVKSKAIDYPIALDMRNEVSGLYNVTGIPMMVAIDQDGTILYSGHSIEEMEARVNF